MTFLEELRGGVMCGDGAMGTMLLDAGAPIESCLEEFCLTRPELVSDIHRQYAAVGARILTTNSFGANLARLSRHGLESHLREINLAAVRLAKIAARASGAYVAASVGPTGITLEEIRDHGWDRRAIFREQISVLIEAGADVVIFETFLDADEMADALAAKLELTRDIPAICSFASAAEGHLSSGLPLEDAFARMRAQGAEVVGVNCLQGPQATVRVLQHIAVAPGDLLSAFPNAGYPRYVDGRFLYNPDPAYFARIAQELVAQGARLVGGCCGTGPAQIAAMAQALRGLTPVTSKAAVLKGDATAVPRPLDPALASAPMAGDAEEESILDRIAAGKKVVITELDPPKTLDLEKFLRGAKALVEAGSDAITLADNSLAILRVSNVAAATLLKQRHGIMPLLHMSCRDHNLIGLQSALMGMAALGFRHILPLTGDPAKVGDHPGAASVYDLTSIQLIAIAKRMNEGFNHIGNDLRRTTRFVIGCTFNPNAKNLDAQISRLERKLAAGAQYVMTQPVFDPSLVEGIAKRTASYGVPIFLGVWPLMNGRQADFLHNEVPGIVIPESVRTHMAGRDGEEGRRAGLELAKEVSRAVLDHFPGVYLITPFLNYQTTCELAQFARGR
jgi:methionine synthase I (cobalamin-dependent)/5,10-methylenetetrahydrofolate reductase